MSSEALNIPAASPFEGKSSSEIRDMMNIAWEEASGDFYRRLNSCATVEDLVEMCNERGVGVMGKKQDTEGMVFSYQTVTVDESYAAENNVRAGTEPHFWLLANYPKMLVKSLDELRMLPSSSKPSPEQALSLLCGEDEQLGMDADTEFKTWMQGFLEKNGVDFESNGWPDQIDELEEKLKQAIKTVV